MIFKQEIKYDVKLISPKNHDEIFIMASHEDDVKDCIVTLLSLGDNKITDVEVINYEEGDCEFIVKPIKEL